MARVVKKSADRQKAESLPNTLRIASLAAEYKAIDLRAYDVRGVTLVADSFVICSAASEPQLKAIFNGVKEGMKEIGVAPLHTEGASNAKWLVMDYGTIIFHVFREEAREYYDLDGLWGDAPAIELDV